MKLGKSKVAIYLTVIGEEGLLIYNTIIYLTLKKASDNIAILRYGTLTLNSFIMMD